MIKYALLLGSVNRLIIRGRHPKLSVKTRGKIGRILKAHLIGYLGHRAGVLRQQLRGALEAQKEYKLRRRLTRKGFEFTVQVHAAKPDVTREKFDAKLRVCHVVLNQRNSALQKLSIH